MSSKKLRFSCRKIKHFPGEDMAETSGHFTPQMRLCFYGQKDDEDETWYRSDSKIFPEVTREHIETMAEQRMKEANLKYVSWGIDSRLYAYDLVSGMSEYVGNMPIIDLDVPDDIVNPMIMSIVATLEAEGYTRSKPTVVHSGNGKHMYYFDSMGFNSVMKILNHRVFEDFICTRFKRSTFVLGGSVLRLSEKKKGGLSPLKLLVRGEATSQFMCAYMTFIHNIVAGN